MAKSTTSFPQFKTLSSNRSRFQPKQKPITASFPKEGERQQTTVHSTTITHSLLKSSQSQDAIPVMVKKKMACCTRDRVKKTGALSPRAPEKIRKNRDEEMKIYGENACLATFKQRPDSIVRVWATAHMSRKIGDMLSYLAEHKKVYHIVDEQELQRVSGSQRHMGICLLVKKQPTLPLTSYVKTASLQDCLVLVDNISNAHNLGAIARNAAFYGLRGIVLQQVANIQNAATYRIAEGGMESLQILEGQGLQRDIALLKAAGYQILALASGTQGVLLNQLALKDKIALVLTDAIEQDFAEMVDSCVLLSLSQSFKVGLNVAVTTGILMARWIYR